LTGEVRILQASLSMNLSNHVFYFVNGVMSPMMAAELKELFVKEEIRFDFLFL
jgi:hypothetical protein